MKIYSFFANQISKHKQLKKDVWDLRVSLALRPANWIYYDHPDGFVYELTNTVEDMSVWMANGMWGMDIEVAGRKYGGVSLLYGGLSWWRRQAYKAAMRALEKGHIKGWKYC